MQRHSHSNPAADIFTKVMDLLEQCQHASNMSFEESITRELIITIPLISKFDQKWDIEYDENILYEIPKIINFKSTCFFQKSPYYIKH